jgi:hypothetical protein
LRLSTFDFLVSVINRKTSPDDGIIRAEKCREYRSYLIKTLSIVAKQKVLLFTVTGLKIFENVVLRKMLEPKGREMSIIWRKLHNEERHDNID